MTPTLSEPQQVVTMAVRNETQARIFSCEYRILHGGPQSPSEHEKLLKLYLGVMGCLDILVSGEYESDDLVAFTINISIGGFHNQRGFKAAFSRELCKQAIRVANIGGTLDNAWGAA